MITSTKGVFKSQELPDLALGESRYVMAAGGMYYEQHDDLFHASTEIHHFYRDVNFGSMQLLEHKEFFKPKFPSIPAELVSQCLGFFKAIEDKTDCECGLVLLYDPETRLYRWCCPEQEISKCDLHFTTPVPGKDYPEHLMHFGDVHLHPGMSAYHSWTDERDEMLASDGLHLVVGTPTDWGKWSSKLGKYIGKEKKATEFCAVFVSEGARFKVEPQTVLESIQCEPGPFPEEWLAKCSKPKQKSIWEYGSQTNKGDNKSEAKEKDEGGWKYGYSGY